MKEEKSQGDPILYKSDACTNNSKAQKARCALVLLLSRPLAGGKGICMRKKKRPTQ
jgi:hypothetical protein